MKQLNKQEENYINELLELQRQKYMTTSWKRRNDIEKAIKKREAQWWQYLDYKRGKKSC